MSKEQEFREKLDGHIKFSALVWAHAMHAYEERHDVKLPTNLKDATDMTVTIAEMANLISSAAVAQHKRALKKLSEMEQGGLSSLLDMLGKLPGVSAIDCNNLPDNMPQELKDSIDNLEDALTKSLDDTLGHLKKKMTEEDDEMLKSKPEASQESPEDIINKGLDALLKKKKNAKQ